MSGNDSADFTQPSQETEEEHFREIFIEEATAFVKRNPEIVKFRIPEEDRDCLVYEWSDKFGNSVVQRSYWGYNPDDQKDTSFEISRYLALVKENGSDQFRILSLALYGEPSSHGGWAREHVTLSFVQEDQKPTTNLKNATMQIDNRLFVFDYDDTGDISKAWMMPEADPLRDPENIDFKPQYQFLLGADIQALKEGREIPHFIPGGVIKSKVIGSVLHIQRVEGDKVLDTVKLPFNAPSSSEVSSKLLDPYTNDKPYDAPTQLDKRWEDFFEVMKAAGITWESN